MNCLFCQAPVCCQAAHLPVFHNACMYGAMYDTVFEHACSACTLLLVDPSPADFQDTHYWSASTHTQPNCGQQRNHMYMCIGVFRFKVHLVTYIVYWPAVQTALSPIYIYIHLVARGSAALFSSSPEPCLRKVLNPLGIVFFTVLVRLVEMLLAHTR